MTGTERRGGEIADKTAWAADGVQEARRTTILEQATLYASN